MLVKTHFRLVGAYLGTKLTEEAVDCSGVEIDYDAHRDRLSESIIISIGGRGPVARQRHHRVLRTRRR